MKDEAAKSPMAALFGKKAKGSANTEPDAEPDMDEGEDGMEDFEAFAVEAFPELKGNSKRLNALWEAVRCCK